MKGFALEETTVKDPQARLSLSGSVPKLAAKAGKRLFLKPEFLFSQTALRTISKDRDMDLFIPHGYNHLDTLSIQLPGTYQTERLPEPVCIESGFGSYSLSMTQNEREIKVIRHLEIYRGTFEQSQFAAYNSFARLINKSDQTRIVVCQQ